VIGGNMKKIFVIFFAAVNFLPVVVYAVVPNQVDNFQDGTTQNWTSGSSNPIQPAVLSGGFAGSSDKFLRIVSNGSSGAGGKLVFFNMSQWSGNYISANIGNISMRVKNSGTSPLILRLAFNGTAGWFVSTNPINLPVDSAWKLISFPIHPANLTGTGDATSTLSAVTTMRILHNSTANFVGEPIIGQLDVDDITAVAVTDIGGENPGVIPKEYSIEQNYPNPFNPSTTIKFSLPKTTHVTLSIYNSIGQEAAKLISKDMNAGVYTTEWNATSFTSGVYYYRIVAGNFAEAKKLLLLK